MKQKKSILTVALVAILFGFNSCGNSQKQTAENDHSDHQAMDHSDHTSDQSMMLTKEQTQQVLASYLEIKEALVQTDGTLASSAANGLLNNLGEHKGELLDKIRFDTEHINETKDAGHQRDHFNTLSDNIYELIKASSANENTIYRQYCPMAFDNKGAFWLSAEKEIRNPYFGDRMLKCGSVKEEI
ncbi:MAG: hypothetical protein CMP48_17285 [Rickettsiales bacterium]|jgi:hypothetical protein|nr:hypothetical protein [Rickettsiales bacterium]